MLFGSTPHNPSDIVSKFSSVGVEAEVVEVNLNMKTAKIYSEMSNVPQEVFYLGDEMLYGLIFSGSGYDCMKTLARERLRLITDIHIGKVEGLIGKTQDQECKGLLNEAWKTLNGFNEQEINGNLYAYREKIEKQNKKLMKEGCPSMY